MLLITENSDRIIAVASLVCFCNNGCLGSDPIGKNLNKLQPKLPTFNIFLFSLSDKSTKNVPLDDFKNNIAQTVRRYVMLPQ